MKPEQSESSTRHESAGQTEGGPRRSTQPTFVLALSLLVLSVALLWQSMGMVVGGHGHGHGGQAMAVEEFRAAALAFADAYGTEDGGVRPPLPADSGGAALHADHSDHGDAQEGHDDHADHGSAVDVYLMAQQWSFLPRTIYLEQGVDYRFRMMATDVHHGVAIDMGEGSRVWRLPPGVLVEATLSFDEAGEYFLYCSFFCGLLHEGMMARIVVA